MLFEITSNGDPLSNHIFWSLLFLGLIFKIIKFKINHQINLGISTILGSDKNSDKYFLTADVVGALEF